MIQLRLKQRLFGPAGLLIVSVVLAGCTTISPPVPETQSDIVAALERASETSIFGPAEHFLGSELADVGSSEIYPVRMPEECEVAVVPSGEDSFAARMELIRNARHSIRIQALVFSGDEAGIRIAEVLKRKKAEGIDIKIIVDGLSNPLPQTQWMYFDLKQHGIEVEGYEALALQWINELPIPFAQPHFDPERPNKRFHEKLWLVDAETPRGRAITGGLNIANEYFRVDPLNPDGFWRDQDVAVRGNVLEDLTRAFDQTFEYLVDIKKSRGIFNTNLYWDATRSVLDHTGKFPVTYTTEERLRERIEQLEQHTPQLDFRQSRCRFLHNRPRFGESYILQAYLKLFAEANEEILIANAYFVPTPAIMAGLKAAAKSCVTVTLITNSPATNDLPEISMVGRGYYKDLLAINDSPEVKACPDQDAGIHIWEWVGLATDDPVQQGTMHSKFAIVDRRLSLVGSYNLDFRSERLNSESSLVFEEPALSAELVGLFHNDLRYSRRVSVNEAALYEDPNDLIYRFRKEVGQFFEEEL